MLTALPPLGLATLGLPTLGVAAPRVAGGAASSEPPLITTLFRKTLLSKAHEIAAQAATVVRILPLASRITSSMSRRIRGKSTSTSASSRCFAKLRAHPQRNMPGKRPKITRLAPEEYKVSVSHATEVCGWQKANRLLTCAARIRATEPRTSVSVALTQGSPPSASNPGQKDSTPLGLCGRPTPSASLVGIQRGSTQHAPATGTARCLLDGSQSIA